MCNNSTAFSCYRLTNKECLHKMDEKNDLLCRLLMFTEIKVSERW